MLAVDPRVRVTLVEGQGSILHPAYAPVTFSLLLGCAPDLLVLCHDVGRTTIDGFAVDIPSLRTLIAAHREYLAPIKSAGCVGIALNTSSLEDAQARAIIASAQRETGLPVTDPIRYGAQPLWQAIFDATATTAKAKSANELAAASRSR